MIMRFRMRHLRYIDKCGFRSQLACLLACLLLLAPTRRVQAQGEEGYVVDKIIAKVDNYIVLKSELDRAYLDYVSNGGTPSEQTRCQFLALLVRNKLMMAKAEIDSVVVDEGLVDQNTQRRIDLILAQYGGSVNELEDLYGKTMDQIKLELRDQIKEQLVVQEMEDQISSEINVTPSEVRRFFNRIPTDSLPYFSAEAEVGQIVKIATISDTQKEQTKAQLIDLRDRVLAGEDFATLARKYSDDPSVAANGGDMGYVGRGVLVPQFEATAFRLKRGEISMPVETRFGFHIIQLLDRRGNEYHARHILMAPEPSLQDIDRAKHFLDSLRTQIVNDSTTFEKAAKEFSDDIETKASGGYFSDMDGGTSLLVDDLDVGVFLMVDTMKVGSISKPVAYRTDDGKDAARILFYRSRTSPHQASLATDWHRIQTATLNQKKGIALQKWFNKARNDVFIDIDPDYDYCGLLDR